MKSAYEILNNPFLNKGTAFTHQERQRLGLTGLLPHAVQTLDEQSQQAYAHYNQKPSLLEKRQFLMEIFNTHPVLPPIRATHRRNDAHRVRPRYRTKH